MKKQFFLIAIFFLILFIPTVEAKNAEEVAKCTYSDTFDNGAKIELSLTVMDDWSIKYSHEHNEYYEFEPDRGYTYQYDIDGYAKALYVDKKKIASACPKLVAVIDGPFLRFYYGQDAGTIQSIYPSYSGIYTLEGKLKKLKKIESDTRKEVTICERSKKLVNSQLPLHIRFYKDLDGKDRFEVYFEGHKDTSSSASADGGTTIRYGQTSYIISMDPDESKRKAFFDKDSCSKTPLYLRGSASDVFYITTEEPPAGENPADWEGGNDKGEDYVDPDKEGQSANNGNWNPNDLCADGGCNIDITEFCTDPYVSRTLKFLGLLLQIAKILVPAIIIVLGFVDLGKIIMAGKMDEVKKQAKNIFTRIVIGAGIFLLPTVLITIFNVANNIAENNATTENMNGDLYVPLDYENCVNCILKPDSCLIQEKGQDQEE